MKEFFLLLRNPLKFRLFLLAKLPAAYFSGIRIMACDEEHCITSVPYKWLTRNPFGSTYFASLAMAAEMSTGVLALSNIYKRKPAISMLVTGMNAQYFKKATRISIFQCNDGKLIKAAVEEAVSKKTGTTVTAISTGKNREGEEIAVFQFTWSFKVRSA